MDNNARIDLERRLPKRAMALILAGGRGSRLKQLTDTRCKPAVYFGGHFRIIDFVLSNCMNSGLRRIGVLTQYKSHSLLRHLQRGWNFLKSEMHEFVDLIPAQQRVDEEYWYRGTADAVYQSLDIIKSNHPEYVVILAGDHIYKMDYARMLADHALSGAGVTVGCIEVDRQEAKAFGVMAIDENKKVTSFVEKPADPPAMPGKPDRSLASMGIYIFTADYLYRMLDEDIALEGSSHDFGKDIIPKAVGEGQVVAHFFQDSCVYNSEKAPAYWRDVGTIDAYWEANIDLTATVPELNLYDRSWPIWTYQEQLPPAKFVHNEANRRGEAIESSVSAGCILSGSVHNSLLFSNCRVHSYTQIHGAVLLPEVQVGRNVRLTKVVVDRGCRIPDGLVVGEDPDDDARRFYRSEGGVTLITPRMLEKLQG
ncbi:glucose-1-phosphate adenylyltransferase [Lautropia mirabilis]|jgi:glucose-1-phosphate adenylyltransferase|uniref:glucose-1-phosphate adenylyltransferase n=1 Tax=Lautropia mirabilis TaxID=47671 RepID=UPI001CACF2D2|nr:glucose-1-phosphate adenylyltransferase [Lautropia mirabilis]MBF1234936.1 glucose-1-phosphate adenylyltransferase [Lautropia mirabilis]MBF1263107.1 glucose-1-phosphate adenylyltransferase [Lautropia mirabilis]MDC6093727.1 glucose-1-phosphate adenylyltransferase [Lautropia mirabilis]